jgi:hypothetical protein
MTDKPEHETILEELHKKHPIDDIVRFSEIDLQDKLRDNAFMVVKYSELYQKELDTYNKISELKDRVTGRRYDHYRFNFNKELTPAEIKGYYLPKDKAIIKIDKLLRRQKWRVDFFDICVKAIDKMGWNMKTFWDSYKRGL